MSLVHSEFHFYSKNTEWKPVETAKALPGLTLNRWYLCGFHLKEKVRPDMLQTQS